MVAQLSGLRCKRRRWCERAVFFFSQKLLRCLTHFLNQTLKNSIAQRWFIVAAAIAVTIWGVFSLTQMPLDVFPEFAPPQVDIHTEAPGLAPEEV